MGGRQCEKNLTTIALDSEDLEVEYANNSTRMSIDRQMTVIHEAVQKLEDANLTIAFKYDELQNIKASLNQCEIVGLNESAQVYTTRMKMTELEILKLAESILAETNTVGTNTVSLIKSWKELKSVFDRQSLSFERDQRLYANGRKLNMSTRGLQQSAEYLIKIAWNLRQNLITVNRVTVCFNKDSLFGKDETGSQTQTVSDLIATVTSLIQTLVQDTFLVVHQPCQVVRTNTRFYVQDGKSPTEVRLLVGSMLGLNLTPPSVSVKIIDTATYKDLKDNGLHANLLKEDTNAWRLTPQTSRMEFPKLEQSSRVIFTQLCLRNFNRSGKNQDRRVTEEKFYLLFRSEFHVGNEKFRVWTTSLPVVVTTHWSQDNLAWGVITWHNDFFAEDNIPDHACWPDVRDMLNHKFSSIAGAPLNEENLQHLAGILATHKSIHNFPESLSWTDLCKTNLPDRNFTFWDWFFGIAELIKEHLQDAWINGHIVGFMEKGKCEKLLYNNNAYPYGTFLFRFSDSLRGAISTVWLHSDGCAYSGEPFEIKSLVNQPLAEKLNQEGLFYVYPNIPKEDAFKKYFDEYNEAKSKRPGKKGGYVKVENRPVVVEPSISKFSSGHSTPQRIEEFGQLSRPEQSTMEWDEEGLADLLRCVREDLANADELGDDIDVDWGMDSKESNSQLLSL